ncbi:bifunctional RNase H/acid phosphatase [Streptomyces sp. Je 1-4]|uniref:bifunctional RNase H/acid phosphatase n=1 Tax=Streptomyces TaxID=1883 RepID=UPI00140EC6D0|nr:MULTISPECIES: bifunctional RNase H/acid phosphatase [unclassified Streptomyces]QIK09032.1 bifunctional RNase H/acid phosphatase [Streptomyces sp. ID38640]UYB42725.1 bifunctional RNase H/acid phosphatase [Streptomyces sp. Je 1-4]UZQ39051.1 bifunctional RNase H/acid phosphatase [Streptomyces sp. Je 1-4] [Streptomyces sp. Je 1-4 4N24]UZQ46468.1 bifunctional RNase H/acid phosphatase [Streptomyces sp. Je 1-4] [Streptomyces sp. Je 1-4 4N24_ara]
MARTLIVEADGGSRGNPGPAGYGAVVLDPETGEALAEAAEFIGTATNNVAEYKGLVAGLRAAHALDPQACVRVRMDSKLVVEQMSGRWKIKHPDMKPLAAEARSVIPPDRVTYEWIPRAQNKHADRLANEAMDAGKIGKQWEPRDSRAALATAAAPARSAAARAADEAAESAEAADAAPSAPPAGWGAPDLGPPATFVLLRHGETALTPEKRFSGSGGTDPELSAAGRRQAEATAAALAARGTIQAVVSSPLRRCRETAEAVAARLGLEVRIEEGLRETDFGAWEGLTFAEVRERFPEDLDAWLGSARVAPTGGGESFAAVARRVAVARDKLLARYAGRTVLLVTHVTPVKTLVRLALGAPPESLFRMELSAASLSAVAYFSDGNASVRLLNDTSHLR